MLGANQSLAFGVQQAAPPQTGPFNLNWGERGQLKTPDPSPEVCPRRHACLADTLALADYGCFRVCDQGDAVRTGRRISSND